MTTHNFSIREVFRAAWGKTLEHAWYLLCVTLGGAIIMGAIRFMSPLSVLVGIFVGVAILTVALIIVSDGTPTFADLLKNLKSYKIVWHYILASLIYALIVLVGLIALILPGIYLMIRLQFYKFLVIEHPDMKPMDTIKRSYHMTRGHFWKLFAFTILLILINLLGALLLGLGLLVTIPVSVLASTFVYRKLHPSASATA